MEKVGLEHAGHWSCHLTPHCQDCGETSSSQLVELAVVEDSQLAVVAGQEFYTGEEGQETVLVVRANIHFSVCQASRGRAECEASLWSISQVSKDLMNLQVDFRAGREVCQDQICLGVLQAIPSCVLTVRQVSPRYRGLWTFQLTAEDRESGSPL